MLPFLFIFNTDLLLMDVKIGQGVLVFIIATMAMLIFAAATQGWFVVRSRWYESVLLLLIAFTLFRPGFWLDRLYDPYEEIAPQAFVQTVGELRHKTDLRLVVEGEDHYGKVKSTVMLLRVPRGESGAERLQTLGLEVIVKDDKLIIDHVAFGSPAAALGLQFDQQILSAMRPVERIRKEVMWLPAFGLLALVVWLQRRRRAA